MTFQQSILHCGTDFDLAATILNPDPPVVSSPRVINKATSLSHSPPRSTRKRATKACLICRTRKVRCNVVAGKPCVNCKMDGVLCVVPKRRPRKSHQLALKSSLEATIEWHEEAIYPKSKPDCSMASGVKSPISTLASPTLSVDRRSCTTQVGESADRVSNIDRSVRAQLNQSKIQEPYSYEYRLDHSLLTPPSSGLDFESQLKNFLIDSAFVYLDPGCSTCFTHSPSSRKYDPPPSYIRPLSEHLSADNIYFIQKKDALLVSETTLCNQLIQCDSRVDSVATHKTNSKYWETILEGLRNSEGGSLVIDMNWI